MTTINALQLDPTKYLRNVATGTGEAETTARTALQSLGLGTDTKSIESFQRANGLKVDGLIGRETIAKLTAKAPTAAELSARPADNQTRVSATPGNEASAAAAIAAKLPPKAAPADATAAVAAAPAKAGDQPSITLGKDGKLSVTGSSANEEIVVAQDGDMIRARIRNIRDPNQSLERSFAAKDVKSTVIDSGDGNDLIWNGTRGARGVDNATILASGSQGNDVNAVFSRGNNVNIVAGNGRESEIAAFGDNVTVSGAAKGKDVIRVVGDHARVTAQSDDRVGVAGRDSRIDGAGTLAATNGKGYVLAENGRSVNDVDVGVAAVVGLEINRRANNTGALMEGRSREIDALKK